MTYSLVVIAMFAAFTWVAMAVAMIGNSLKIRQLQPIQGPISVDLPEIDVVIPALNEEERIETTINRILAQEYPRLNITVINDRSTDRTGEILDRLAQSRPIRVIHGEPRPVGWVGKTWAVTQGAKGGKAEWLLFVDGDIDLHPRAVATAIDQARKGNADLVSIIAWPEVKTFLQGAVAITLGQALWTMYPLHKVNDPKSPVALAAGGFILTKRSIYESIGGHEAVRAEIVEDIQLGKVIKRAGGRLSVHLAPSLASTHMYGTFREIWVGLRKNAYAGTEYRLFTLATGLIGGLIMGWTPMIATIAGIALGSWPLALAGAFGWLAQIVAIVPSILYLRISPLFVFSLPVGVTLYVSIACSSAWHHFRGRILWKDVTFASKEVREASRKTLS